jgi:hypothetical protein
MKLVKFLKRKKLSEHLDLIPKKHKKKPITCVTVFFISL